VPVAPYRLRGKMRASWALVSAAGPLSNLVLAMLAAIPLRLGWVSLNFSGASISFADILLQFIYINLALTVFNLIPFPPLDGSRILAWMLPPKWAGAMDRLERMGGMGLLIVVFALSRFGILSRITEPVFNFMLRALLLY
jgi:Zn-dependent protease